MEDDIKRKVALNQVKQNIAQQGLHTCVVVVAEIRTTCTQSG
jgi:hypothetical protein